MKNKAFTITSFYKFVYWSIESKTRYQLTPFNAAMSKYIKSFNKNEIKDLESYKWKPVNDFIKHITATYQSPEYNFNLWTNHFQNNWECLKSKNTIKAVVAWYLDEDHIDPQFGFIYRYRDKYIKLPYYFDEDTSFLKNSDFYGDNEVKIFNSIEKYKKECGISQ